MTEQELKVIKRAVTNILESMLKLRDAPCSSEMHLIESVVDLAEMLNLKEFKESANRRLDSHDKQNEAILVLAEQVKSMGDDVRDLKRVIMKEN